MEHGKNIFLVMESLERSQTVKLKLLIKMNFAPYKLIKNKLIYVRNIIFESIYMAFGSD